MHVRLSAVCLALLVTAAGLAQAPPAADKAKEVAELKAKLKLARDGIDALSLEVARLQLRLAEVGEEPILMPKSKVKSLEGDELEAGHFVVFGEGYHVDSVLGPTEAVIYQSRRGGQRGPDLVLTNYPTKGLVDGYFFKQDVVCRVAPPRKVGGRTLRVLEALPAHLIKPVDK